MSATESSLRKYLKTFNGTETEFSEEQDQLFNALFHDKFNKTTEVYNKDREENLGDKYSYKKVNREEVKAMHAKYSSEASKITLVHYRKIGIDCVDVEFQVKNGEGERNVRVVFSIEDEKFVTARDVDSVTSVLRARLASDIHFFGMIGKYQTNM